MTPFETALAYLIQNEGTTYTNDPQDAGGPTKFGVTLKAFSLFKNREIAPIEIEALTQDEVNSFYDVLYWQRLRCPRMRDTNIATGIFDMGVLFGVLHASIACQQALAFLGEPLAVDAVIGDKTLLLLNRIERSKFIDAFQTFILRRIETVIRNKPSNEKYRKGWVNRAERLTTLKLDPVQTLGEKLV